MTLTGCRACLCRGSATPFGRPAGVFHRHPLRNHAVRIGRRGHPPMRQRGLAHWLWGRLCRLGSAGYRLYRFFQRTAAAAVRRHCGDGSLSAGVSVPAGHGFVVDAGVEGSLFVASRRDRYVSVDPRFQLSYTDRGGRTSVCVRRSHQYLHQVGFSDIGMSARLLDRFDRRSAAAVGMDLGRPTACAISLSAGNSSRWRPTRLPAGCTTPTSTEGDILVGDRCQGYDV